LGSIGQRDQEPRGEVYLSKRCKGKRKEQKRNRKNRIQTDNAKDGGKIHFQQAKKTVKIGFRRHEQKKKGGEKEKQCLRASNGAAPTERGGGTPKREDPKQRKKKYIRKEN